MVKKAMMGCIGLVMLFLFSGCDYFGYCYYHIHGDPDFGSLFLLGPAPEREFLVNMKIPSGKYTYTTNDILRLDFSIQNITNRPIQVDYFLGAWSDELETAFVRTNIGFLQATGVNQVNQSWAFKPNLSIPPMSEYTYTTEYRLQGNEPQGVLRVFGVATDVGALNNGYDPDDIIEVKYISTRFKF
jgi:hypothetical protein